MKKRIPWIPACAGMTQKGLRLPWGFLRFLYRVSYMWYSWQISRFRMSQDPVVAIVGRPNVGKSALLNRIVGYRHAIVDPTPGVTRDRNYAIAAWNGRRFQVIDTGGLDSQNKKPIQKAIHEQVDFALSESDAVILVCDSKDGLTSPDIDVLKLLRKNYQHPVYVCINKMDDPSKEDSLYDFCSLGIKELFPVSAFHGHGVADLLDAVVASFPLESHTQDLVSAERRLAIVGKPNVGKSSLFNKLIGQNRSIVDDAPGTTRDSITVSIEKTGKTYSFIDTAGLRRPARNKESVENFSVQRALKSIKESDIAVLVLDSSEREISEQDKRIATRIREAGSACIVVWNKWDVLEKDKEVWDSFCRLTRSELKLFDFAPILSCSAKTGLRVSKLFELIDQVQEAGDHRIPIERLKEILFEAMTIQPPPQFRGKPLVLKNLSQLNGPGIQFKIKCSEPKSLHFSYQRYILNQIRQEFDFIGWPLRIIVRN
ncbi:ribosome biogenesis GTPase Der [bacterium]|nr:ribosome biogenesis GTPase Der [bacterium]